MSRFRPTALTSLVLFAGSAPSAGAALVYERPASGEIVAAADDGSAARVVARGRLPAVSPDGRRIAYVSGGSGSGGAIRVVATLGGRSWPAVGAGRAIRSRAAIWSPDGKRLLASARREADAYVVDVRTRTRSKLRFAGDLLDASFSPDGRRVLVQRLRVALTSTDLLLIRLSDRRRREIRRATLPLWSRRRVAWRTSDEGGRYGGAATYAAIVVGRTLTGSVRELLRGAPSLGPPIAWSANGARLLVADHESGEARAVVIETSSGRAQTLPVAFDSGDADRSAIVDLSRDGQLVLGEAGGNVLAEDLSGAVSVLAAGAASPSWTR